MKNLQNPLRIAVLLCAAVIILSPMAARADDTQKYLTAEEYVEQARPYLHLSCKGAWAEAREDADAYVKIIDKVAVIGFLNHELDVEALGKLPEKELVAFRTEYYNNIGDQCRENPNRLLAAVVEESLLETFTRIQPDAEMK